MRLLRCYSRFLPRHSRESGNPEGWERRLRATYPPKSVFDNGCWERGRLARNALKRVQIIAKQPCWFALNLLKRGFVGVHKPRKQLLSDLSNTL